MKHWFIIKEKDKIPSTKGPFSDEQVSEFAHDLPKFYPDAELLVVKMPDENTLWTETVQEFLFREQACEAMRADDNARIARNEAALAEVKRLKGEAFETELRSYITALDCVHTMALTPERKGTKQEIDEIEVVSLPNVEYVHQWRNGGYSGDDYAGDIYIEINPGLYFRMTYEM